MKKSHKILALVPYPIDGPSSRYRFYQYVEQFKSHQIHVESHSLMSHDIYSRRMQGKKLKLIDYFNLLISIIYRILLILFTKADVLIIYRELSPISRSLSHFLFSFLVKKPFIYDFDDAVYLDYYIDDLLKRASAIVPGNSFLANYAESINSEPLIQIIPTVVDTQYYTPKVDKHNSDFVIIGWIGTKSTYERYLAPQILFLTDLAKRFRARIHVIGPIPIRQHVVDSGAYFIEWSLDTERDYMSQFDIGLMPLFDDEYTKGKCAFKLIEYGACAIPSVASCVGANLEVIVENETGFLVNSEYEWEQALIKLILSPSLRSQMGAQARERIVSLYSLEAQVPMWVDIIRHVANESFHKKSK